MDSGLWCPVGPGARRGLNRIYGRPVQFCVNNNCGVLEKLQLREMFQLKHFMEVQNPGWCSQMDIGIQDVQFQLCEFDKYDRAVQGGRGYVAKYVPGQRSWDAESASFM